jgi:hypothetical protein
MAIKNRQQWLLILAAAGAALLIGDKLVITPLTASWQARSKQIAELTKQVNQGSLLVSRDTKCSRRLSGGRRKAVSAFRRSSRSGSGRATIS